MELTTYTITSIIDVIGLLAALHLIKSDCAYRNHFFIFLYFALSSLSNIVAGQILFTGHVTILPAPALHKLVISLVLLSWVIKDLYYSKRGGLE